MNTEPYASYPQNPYYLIGYDIQYLDDLLQTTDLLEFFYEKYGSSGYHKKNDSIMIDVKDYKL